MSGSVEHMTPSEARADSSSDQSRLTSFDSDTHYVSIVTTVSDDMERSVDEHEPALAPPDDLFYQWHHTKENIDTDNEVAAHNEALDRIDYRSRFGEYLATDPDAQDALDRLLDRVDDGERIVLVCYCGEGKWCHRESVTETLKSMADERLTV